MLQSVFIGKAREIYASLDVDQSVDYNIFKEAILKGDESDTRRNSLTKHTMQEIKRAAVR